MIVEQIASPFVGSKFNPLLIIFLVAIIIVLLVNKKEISDFFNNQFKPTNEETNEN